MRQYKQHIRQAKITQKRSVIEILLDTHINIAI